MSWWSTASPPSCRTTWPTGAISRVPRATAICRGPPSRRRPMGRAPGRPHGDPLRREQPRSPATRPPCRTRSTGTTTRSGPGSRSPGSGPTTSWTTTSTGSTPRCPLSARSHSRSSRTSPRCRRIPPISPSRSTCPSYTVTAPNNQFIRIGPEFSNNFDNAGQNSVASERSRRYVLPQDPAGVGRAVAFMQRPKQDYDFGKGSDKFGRASFFRYFRPPGLPQEIRYPYTNFGNNFTHWPYAPTSPASLGQQYLMPVLLPEGYSVVAGPNSKADRHTNVLHGYQSMLTPNAAAASAPGTAPPPPQVVASMAALPYDWDVLERPTTTPPTGDVPTGYNPTTPSTEPDHAACHHDQSVRQHAALLGHRHRERPEPGVDRIQQHRLPHPLRGQRDPGLRPQQRPGLRRPGRQRFSRRQPEQGRGRRDEPLQPRPDRPALRTDRPGVALPEARRRRRHADQPALQPGPDQLPQPGRRDDPPPPLLDRRLGPQQLRLRQRQPAAVCRGRLLAGHPQHGRRRHLRR